MLPKKELQAQRQELYRTLLPELQIDRLLANGINFPKDEYNILNILTTEQSGLAFLNALNVRMDKAIQYGAELDIKIQDQLKPTHLSSVKDNLDITGTIINQLLPEMKTLSQPTKQAFANLIGSVFFVGYHAGCHDYFTASERHVNNGFTNQVINPQSGGIAKSDKAKQVKILIRKIAEFSFAHEALNKIPKSLLAEAIYELINDFANKNPNTTALKAFKNNSPEVSTIDKWLKPIKKQKIKSDLETPSQNKTLQLLKKEFPNKVINNFLK